MCIDENMLKVTSYQVLGKLPDPFIFADGTRVTTAEEWPRRKNEIYQSAINLQFGTIPPPPEVFSVEKLNQGKAQQSYLVHAGTERKQASFLIKVILPKSVKRPVIIDGDLCSGYLTNDGFIQAALNNDIGWVFFDRTELAHDIVGEGRRNGALYDIYPEYTFGALGAWAWGYSRCIDALEKLSLPQIDLTCLTFSGHSRGGKAALLAGAIDERAAIVNPNEACLGACGCYRIRMAADYLDLPNWRSETLNDLLTSTAFWLGPEMVQYRDREAELPFDAHFLKAMVAPRTLLVSEAAGDIWANPIGSWQTTIAAGEVFKFLHASDNLLWYFREGTHYHTVCDIEMLANAIAHKHDGTALNNDFFKLPFKAPERIFNWVAPK